MDDLRRVLIKLTAPGEDVLRNLSRHTLIELHSIGSALVGSLSELIDGTNEFIRRDRERVDEFAEEGE